MVQKFLIAALFALYAINSSGCATTRAAVPGDLLGLILDMPRPAAESRLSEMGQLLRTESGRQEIWQLKGDPRFSTIGIGFDKDDRVRYVTVFVDKKTVTERMAFSTIGDISKAKAEIQQPHYRYIWDVKRAGDGLSYVVNVYGDDPTYLTMYTLSRSAENGSAADEDDDD